MIERPGVIKNTQCFFKFVCVCVCVCQKYFRHMSTPRAMPIDEEAVSAPTTKPRKNAKVVHCLLGGGGGENNVVVCCGCGCGGNNFAEGARLSFSKISCTILCFIDTSCEQVKSNGSPLQFIG